MQGPIKRQKDETDRSASMTPVTERTTIAVAKAIDQTSALKGSGNVRPLISDSLPFERPFFPAISASLTDCERVEACTARARSTYQMISQVYHYERTFEQVAQEHHIFMEELGSKVAVFAMQTMQGLRAKGMYNETSFLAMGLNEEGLGEIPMAQALDIARTKRGVQARERRIEEGLLVTEGMRRSVVGSDVKRRAQSPSSKSVKFATRMLVRRSHHDHGPWKHEHARSDQTRTRPSQS